MTTRRPSVLAALVVTAALAAGCAPAPIRAAGPPAEPAAAPSSSLEGSGTARAGDPVGVATSWVLSGQAVIDAADDEAVAAVVARYATAEAQPALTADAVGEREVLRAAAGGSLVGVRWRQAVLSSTDTPAGTVEGRRVVVWHVGALWGPALPPQSQWATSTVDLVEVDGEWRVQAVASTPGPAPAADGRVAPATAAELAAVDTTP